MMTKKPKGIITLGDVIKVIRKRDELSENTESSL